MFYREDKELISMTSLDPKDLSNLLKSPLTLHYNKRDKQNQPAQIALRECRKILLQLLPPGFVVRNSGSQPNLPEIVWISILNPEITKSTRNGFYIVFLYDSDFKNLYLSLNQGYTEHNVDATKKGFKGKAKKERAYETLRQSANEILNYIEENLVFNDQNLKKKIILNSNEELAVGYEAGHIIGYKYKISDLPATNQILSDLDVMIDLYDVAIRALGEINMSSVEQRLITSIAKIKPRSTKKYQKELKFKSKQINTHFRTISLDKIEVNPLHEDLIERFVQFVEQLEWKAVNMNIHPRDLILIKDKSTEVLVEAKVVSSRDSTVVREAFAQLFEYKYRFHFEQNIPLVALFNRKISQENMQMLEYYGIKTIYFNAGNWEGNARELLGLS